MKIVVRARGTKGQPGFHVDAAEGPGDVHRVIDVGLDDVRFVRVAGEGVEIAVAGAVDDALGENRLAAFLALEHHALHRAAFDDGRGRPAVQHQVHLVLGQKAHRLPLQPFGGRWSASA